MESGSSGSTGNISRTRTPTITEMSKLEAEINHLKRQLDVRQFFYINLSYSCRKCPRANYSTCLI